MCSAEDLQLLLQLILVSWLRKYGNTLRTYKSMPSALKRIVNNDFLAENCGIVVDGLAKNVS